MGAADYGGILRPGRKRQGGPEPVIRRTSSGRTQIGMTREGHWTSEIEADFLARLRATGNFERSARAVGFQPASVQQRVRKWPAFEREVREALEEADVHLNYALVAHAHALLGRGERGCERGEAEPNAPIDPKLAMQIIGFIEARRGGRTGRGRLKGPPERGFEEAKASILAKIEAIERHESWLAEQAKKAAR